MGSVLVISIISDTIVAVAIPFYLLLMAACIKYRHQDPFRSSFFALTFSQGVADLMTIANVLIILKPAMYYGLFTNVFLSYPLLFGRLQAFFSLGLICSQHISFVTIAFNRFTAVCVPIKHNTIWNRKTAAIAIIAQWLIPLVIHLPLLTIDIRFCPHSNGSCLDNSCLTVVWANTNLVSGYYILSFAYILVVVIVCSVLYALQFRTMWKQKSMAGAISSQARIELRLALMGAMIFAISSSFLFFLITSIVAPSVIQSALDLSWLYFLISDITSSVNPFVLIGMSRSVRRKCFEMLCGVCIFDHHVNASEIPSRIRTNSNLL